jgi:hypothetical protein
MAHFSTTRYVLIAVFLTCAARLPVLAQADAHGEIVGRLTDRSGAVLPGVRIAIAGSNTLRREGITDADGRFQVSDLAFGTYPQAAAGIASDCCCVHRIGN